MIFRVCLETKLVVTSGAFEEKPKLKINFFIMSYLKFILPKAFYLKIVLSLAFFHPHIKFSSDIGIVPTYRTSHGKRHHHSHNTLSRPELSFRQSLGIEIRVKILDQNLPFTHLI